MTRARGGSGSSRETMTTGRNLAANPRSAVQTSPGCGFIEEVQDFLLHPARAYDIEEPPVGQLNDFGHLAPDLFGGLLAPFTELSVQPLNKDVHGSSPSLLLPSRESRL